MPRRRVLWLATAVAAVLVIAGAGLAYALTSRNDSPPTAAPSAAPSVARTSASPAPSPGADITGPLDLLLVGVDTRVTIPDWEPHADSIMVMHVEADLRSAYLTSLPRDLRVSMPAFAPAGFPGGRYKITEAMSRGSRVPGSKKPNPEQGYQLLSRVVSSYTGIKKFHAGAVLTFTGLSRLTDALGGVTMRIDTKVLSQHRKPDGTLRPMRPGGGGYTGPQATYLPGSRTLVGWQALDYARQRYGLKNGDYDRQRHQRQLVAALLAKAASSGLATDQPKLDAVLRAMGDTLVYAGDRSPVEYAYAVRDLEPSGITLVGLPGDSVLSGGGYLGEQLLPVGRAYFKAVAQGRVAAFVAAHPELVNK
ncbi:LCP family protein [Actinoplanes sp. NPDC051633]|uniref:LCP family protein n=1 Tax=Actinoplanes sp. NPDC051633 TaxID=3155670 RepID=UPI003422469B